MLLSSPAGGPRRGNVEGAVLLALDAEEFALSVHDLRRMSESIHF